MKPTKKMADIGGTCVLQCPIWFSCSKRYLQVSAIGLDFLSDNYDKCIALANTPGSIELYNKLGYKTDHGHYKETYTGISDGILRRFHENLFTFFLANAKCDYVIITYL